MKEVSIFALFYFLLFFTAIPANASCEMNKAKRCYVAEKTKSDSTRAGLSASEFCAAEAFLHCRENQTPASKSQFSNEHDNYRAMSELLNKEVERLSDEAKR